MSLKRPLMDRIKVIDFLSKTQEERYEMLRKIRLLREADIAMAKTKARKITKSAMRKQTNSPTKRKTTKAPSQAAVANTLGKLSAEELQQMLELFS